ncbi:MAG: DUF6285 domain-containing protein [Pseudomonadota bacterium]
MTPPTVILKALEDFLRSQLHGEREAIAAAGSLATYQTKIATNLLRMLRREQELAPTLLSWDRNLAAYAKLPTEADVPQALARALRDGYLEVDETLIGMLRQRTLTRLQIDNPRYSGYLEAERRWSGAEQLVDEVADENG